MNNHGASIGPTRLERLIELREHSSSGGCRLRCFFIVGVSLFGVGLRRCGHNRVLSSSVSSSVTFGIGVHLESQDVDIPGSCSYRNYVSFGRPDLTTIRLLPCSDTWSVSLAFARLARLHGQCLTSEDSEWSALLPKELGIGAGPFLQHQAFPEAIAGGLVSWTRPHCVWCVFDFARVTPLADGAISGFGLFF
ncbi:hypothetical protein U1Q18_050076 [Sarracenia purpurea var. burkii]